jgi:hypothetical protein
VTYLSRPKASGTGIARDPEMVALEDVIAQINDLFSGDHPRFECAERRHRPYKLGVS